MSVGDWIGAIGDLVQMAVVVGGIVWAYYKFVRGRTFARRSDIAVSGTVIEADDRSARPQEPVVGVPHRTSDLGGESRNPRVVRLWRRRWICATTESHDCP